MNDRRSGSSCSGRAASTISARITKWANDSPVFPVGIQQFLPHTVGSFAAEVRRLLGADRVWVRLLFVEHPFDVPVFVVVPDPFVGRVLLGVEQAGQQAVPFAVSRALRIVQCGLDPSHEESLAALLSMTGRRVDLGQARAVAPSSPPSTDARSVPG